jgi:ribose transport system permease protein
MRTVLETAIRWTRRLEVGAQLVSLVIITTAFALGTQGKILSWGNIQVILSLAAIPAILATGLHLTIVAGGIDLSLEGTVAFGAVFVGVLVKNKFNTNDVGLWIVPICIAIGGASGFLAGTLHTRLRIPSFITTLGISWILYGLAVFINKAVLIRLLDERIQTFINAKPLGIANIVIIAVAIAILVQFIEDRTRFGLHLYAIGGDEALARQAGVRVERIKVLAFTVAGCLYGLSALLLVSRMGSATSRTGLNLLFPTLTAVAVGGVSFTGGIGSTKNAILGTLIVTVLNNGMVLMKVSPYVQQAVNGVVLIVAVALTLDRKKLGFIK